jgi:small subunit ribosomal protein S8e
MDRGQQFIETALGDRKVIKSRGMGGEIKFKLKRDSFANLNLPDGTTKRVKILNVFGNSANTDYARRNIITKGALIETEAGNARVTSRVGQHGIINAVLLKENA